MHARCLGLVTVISFLLFFREVELPWGSSEVPLSSVLRNTPVSLCEITDCWRLNLRQLPVRQRPCWLTLSHDYLHLIIIIFLISPPEITKLLWLEFIAPTPTPSPTPTFLHNYKRHFLKNIYVFPMWIAVTLLLVSQRTTQGSSLFLTAPPSRNAPLHHGTCFLPCGPQLLLSPECQISSCLFPLSMGIHCSTIMFLHASHRRDYSVSLSRRKLGNFVFWWPSSFSRAYVPRFLDPGIHPWTTGYCF